MSATASDLSAMQRRRQKLARAKLWRELRTNLPFFAAQCLKIKTKAGGLAPLALNRAQQFLHREIERQAHDTQRVRVIGLKGRQQGFSTYTEGRLYWQTTQRTGHTAFILTHHQDATDNIFLMAQRFHEHCPTWWRPETASSNAKELVFAGRDAGYKVGTAGSKAVGRSSTLQYFHGSEVAHWPNADTHFAGVMQAIPDEAGTEIILESTANGVGGKFYDLWQAARRGENEYRPIFVPWFWQAEYRKPVPPGFKSTPTEAALMKLHDLDAGQVMFRRAKIAELGGELLFMQEYPCTAEEAFIASGRPVFDALKLKAAAREAFKPRWRMALREKKFQEAEAGELRVWFKPEPGARYCLGADVAEGLEHGDFSCASVLKKPDGEQVAQWHGHVAADRFAHILKALGTWYNRALLGVERNNHGLTVVTLLRDLGYHPLYVQRDLADRGSKYDEMEAVGWLTTSKSKYKIIDQLIGDLMDGTLGIFCAETLAEMATYRVNAQGGYEAQAGCFDDRVMARAIAGEMLRADYGYSRGKKAA